MEIVASPEAVDFVRERGGRVFVWLQKFGWASCPVSLGASTEPHPRRDFSRVPADGIEVYVSSAIRNRMPDELHLAVRGLWRKRVSAYWN